MKRLAALLVSLAVLPFAAWADPPGRVGRLAWIQGEVAVFSDPDQGWERAGVNTHLTSENSVWTEPGARAEMRVGSTALRLEETTQLDIVRLDDDVLHAHVVRGSLAIRVRYFERGESFTVTTPDARFQIRGNGRYRVDADAERGESRLTVLAGNARLETAGGGVAVDTGRGIRVTGGAQPAWEYENAQLTALDDWAQARDDRYGEGQASRYVSPRMTGWEELDEYGQWRNEPEYGTVWYPTRVDAGWAPYRYGRWTWVRPWGWSWVDDAPWGYAPFHYGRWVYIGNRWGWYPGRYVPRPVWAPALVGWVGTPGWSVSVSSGPLNVVGWYPLSPFDRYQPWYAANTTYVNNVNHVVIVNRQPSRRYDNRDHGATVVGRENFVSHRPVQSVLAPVGRDVIVAQPVVTGAAVLPSRSEWRGRARPGESRPSAAVPQVPTVGGSVMAPRPAAPTASGTGVPVARPPAAQPAVPAVPTYPATPAAPARIARPVPAEPNRVKPVPAEPNRVKPVPAESNRAKPVPAEPNRVKPVPAESNRAKPVPAEPNRAKPVEPSSRPQSAPTASSATRPAPAQPATTAQPAARGKPVEQTAKQPQAAPRAVEKTPRPEKPAKPAEPSQGD